MDKYIFPNAISASELKKKRSELELTQKEFAQVIGVSKPTIERWETSDQPITGPICLLVYMLTKDYLDQKKIPENTLVKRLWYMYKDTPCTLIDIDESKGQVKIKNYVDNIQFRAFGVNENPNIEDFHTFLEERCFSRDRDKLKLILEDLDLPFYDPYLIINKTEGRMAEDDFWIKVER